MQLLKWIFYREIVTNSLVLPHKKVRIPECVLFITVVIILQYFEGRDNIVKLRVVSRINNKTELCPS